MSIEEMEKECTEVCKKEEWRTVLTIPEISGLQPVSVNFLQSSWKGAPGKAISKEELSKAQQNDPVVGPVYRAVEVGRRPGKSAWVGLGQKSKVLCHQWGKLSIEDGVLLRKAGKNVQIVLPEIYHSTVYSELHEKMGHLASDRVVELARQRFHWPHMCSDIENFIQKKCSCVVSKKPNVQERAPLKPIESSYPFEIVSIDFLHLDKCKGGFEYVLVVCDHFTRFAQAYATKSKSSHAAADKLFNHFILQFGFPKRIHHDRGGEFNSNLFRHLHRLAKIETSNTTPYHPQGDGQVERYNRTLINMLKALPESEKKKWKDHLPKLCFAYNSTIHKSTGFSPFFLMFGRESRLPIDGIFPVHQIGETSRDYGTFVNQWSARMEEAMEIARKHGKQSGDRNKERYDKSAKSVEIDVGDRVLVQNVSKGGTGKLDSFWEQQVYVVTKKREDFPVFELREYLGTKAKTLHRNRLKKVNELEPPEPPKPDKEPPGRKQKKKKEKKVVRDEESSSDSDGEFVCVEQSGVIDAMSDVVSEEGEEEVQGSEASEDVESDDSENTSDSDPRSPRPTRNRQQTKAFMYDKLGGNPVYR
jgi:transposase InsO family protein